MVYVHLTERAFLLRRSYRVGVKVKNETLLCITSWGGILITELKDLLQRRRAARGKPEEQELDKELATILLELGVSPWALHKAIAPDRLQRIAEFLIAQGVSPWALMFETGQQATRKRSREKQA